ncbi:MAG: FprA family A-type flavoprotein [bacterium]|nr:FprA family A-type flavoprotein [bacterium]
MLFKEIKNNVYYAGLNDADRVIFDELIPLEHGTTYNSYLIKGSEKTAVVDTMYPPFSDLYIKNFTENGINKVDYIIANHGEQDHSGSLPDMIKKFPEAIILTNSKCKENIMEMLLIPEDKIRVVQNNEEISLGDKTLRFIMAPGVHWPDTMFTYLVEDNMLFTCDFLGAHLPFEELYAKNDELLYSMAKRYYAEIMMPFRMMCKKYTAMVEEMKPDFILPSHGPIYDKPEFILNAYKDWSSDDAKNLVLISYVSMYGSVEEMVKYVANGLKENGINVYTHDIVRDDLGDLAVELVDAATVIIGASMVLAGPHPMAINTCVLANALKPKTKFVSFLGSYGWGGKLFETLGSLFTSIKPEVIEPVLIKGKLKEGDYKKLDELIASVTEKHKSTGLL